LGSGDIPDNIEGNILTMTHAGHGETNVLTSMHSSHAKTKILTIKHDRHSETNTTARAKNTESNLFYYDTFRTCRTYNSTRTHARLLAILKPMF
jgi:hypothetical protein